VNVLGLTSGIAGISAGSSHTCAVTSSGAVKCWGENVYGQVGDGTTTRRLTPTSVVGLSSGVSTITTGDSDSCAVLLQDGARCWGLDIWGQIGDGGQETLSLTPSRVIGLRDGASAVSGGFYHNCGLTMLGGAVCWGDSTYGQLGDGDYGGGHYSDRPVEVVGFEGPKYLGVKRRGRGTVTSDPAGIDCGSTCTFLFGHGTHVTHPRRPPKDRSFSDGPARARAWANAPSSSQAIGQLLPHSARCPGRRRRGFAARRTAADSPFSGLVRGRPRCYCPARGG
jgi:Regulator of chromosome condensation (RCC1) repeat